MGSCCYYLFKAKCAQSLISKEQSKTAMTFCLCPSLYHNNQNVIFFCCCCKWLLNKIILSSKDNSPWICFRRLGCSLIEKLGNMKYRQEGLLTLNYAWRLEQNPGRKLLASSRMLSPPLVSVCGGNREAFSLTTVSRELQGQLL